MITFQVFSEPGTYEVQYSRAGRRRERKKHANEMAMACTLRFYISSLNLAYSEQLPFRIRRGLPRVQIFLGQFLTLLVFFVNIKHNKLVIQCSAGRLEYLYDWMEIHILKSLLADSRWRHAQLIYFLNGSWRVAHVSHCNLNYTLLNNSLEHFPKDCICRAP